MNHFFINSVSRYYRLKARFYYRRIFGHIGAGSCIMKPVGLFNPECIHIGNGVQIRHGARIEAVRERAGVFFSPRIEIGDGTSIEQGFHLACAEQIIIGKHVAITEYVGIFDIWHLYEDIQVPIKDQPLKTSPVKIGDHSFIGMGAVIQPGVIIGKHCVIGANSVVIRSIPDYSVAVGLPAKVIRRFDPVASQWIKVTENISGNQS
jgi:acetyltransferase-like isoleucine patch superfamily enzyme